MSEDMNESLGKVLKRIYEYDQDKFFYDTKHTINLLSDFAPQMIEERKIFMRVVNEEILEDFKNIYSSENEEKRKIKLSKIKMKLSEEYGFSAEWSNRIINAFAEAFMWELPYDEEQELNSIKISTNEHSFEEVNVQQSCDISSKTEKDEIIEKYKTFLKLDEPNKAWKVLDNYTEKYPDDWYGWWEKFKFPFKFGFNCYNDYLVCEKNANNAKKMATTASLNACVPDMPSEYNKLWKDYIYSLDGHKDTKQTKKILGILLLQGRKISDCDDIYKNLVGTELTLDRNEGLKEYYAKIHVDYIRNENSFAGLSQPLKDYLINSVINAIRLAKIYNFNTYLGYCIPIDEFKKTLKLLNITTQNIWGSKSEFIYTDLKGVVPVFCSEKIVIFEWAAFGDVHFWFTDHAIPIEERIKMIITKYDEDKKIEEEKRIIDLRKKNNQCIYCGGKLSFFGKCKSCGKIRDY